MIQVGDVIPGKVGKPLGKVEIREVKVFVRRPDGLGEWHNEATLESEEKKVERPRKLLPDMDQIDQAVLVWKRLGLQITAIVDDIREKGGLTVTVKPEGPIEINLSGLTIHIPAN